MSVTPPINKTKTSSTSTTHALRLKSSQHSTHRTLNFCTCVPSNTQKQNLIFSMEEGPPSIQDLIFSLQQATFMAKQLPSSSTASPTHLHQIHSSLYHAHRHLSAFLSALPLPPLSAAESSATGEPMQVEDGGDDGGDDEETTSKCTIDLVEEKMRHCFIKNKRPKRPLSPSAAAIAEEKGVSDDGYAGPVRDYDPYVVRLKSLDLLYQFHV
ncbi:unnamed protein product [Sphenostylis stenocarpa]|uniref:Uncharacterized protein n=1 Tax=Sphenostylis stenocarpa TaxID=92480 RepID=A0AA86RW42_9FABA|nr:unnamed protein product [Sphenostylis stenocarpa]